ncbi:hypothetical protein CHS0354_016997, partial [Potamilus streckersoni]
MKGSVIIDRRKLRAKEIFKSEESSLLKEKGHVCIKKGYGIRHYYLGTLRLQVGHMSRT